MNDILNSAVKHARRLIVLVVGATILMAGLAMIVLPGPAVVVIPLGLAVLGTEFIWARRLMCRVKAAMGRTGDERQQSETGEGAAAYPWRRDLR
ncbi:MAG: hypothetical protein HGB21_13770 [Nitrospirae bacterium]|nr:hypothetical protein [Nitrospirota bacterium]NTW67353.1 hypothetical protein [Nitrospirota bacterium]